MVVNHYWTPVVFMDLVLTGFNGLVGLQGIGFGFSKGRVVFQ
jgi:hypothetical protein